MPEPETWYVLEDNAVADPRDVVHDPKDGVLRHKDGRAVKLRPSGVPHSRGVDDPDAERAKAKTPAHAPKAKDQEEPQAAPKRALKPEDDDNDPRGRYRTRTL